MGIFHMFKICTLPQLCLLESTFVFKVKIVENQTST